MTSLIHRVHTWNRARKWDLFTTEVLTSRDQSVLDIGFSAKPEVTDYENDLERSIDGLDRVTGLTIEPIPADNPFPGMTIVRYDGSIFPVEDGEFDVCWSNAVLEHVGDDDAKVLFLSEIRRVGGSCFVTTPNKWFPVEPHTKVPLLHFLLPKPLFDRVLHRLGKSWATGDYMDLLGERRLRALLEQAGVTDYQLRKNRFGPFTMDFVILFEG